MSKRKWLAERTDILQRLLELCEFHIECGGDMNHEPYKDDFRRVCADAYRRRFCGEEWGYCVDDAKPCYERVEPQRPQIDGPAFIHYAQKVGFLPRAVSKKDERYRTLRQVIDWMREWVYAWDHQPKKRRIVRRFRSTDS